jgi:hypothetical protein
MGKNPRRFAEQAWRTLGLLALVLAAGCQPSADLFGRSYLPPSDLQAQAAARNGAPGQPDLWCYRTLGSTECYTRPLPGGESRRIGNSAFAPSPSSAAELRPLQSPLNSRD